MSLCPTRTRRVLTAGCAMLATVGASWVVVAPVQAVGATCAYTTNMFGNKLSVRFTTLGGQTITLRKGVAGQILVVDGTESSFITCSGGTPTVSNTSIIDVSDGVSGGSQTLRVETPADLAGPTWSVDLGDGADTLALVGATNVSLARQTAVVANFDADLDTENEISFGIGIDAITASTSASGGTLSGQGTRNGSNATPVDLPLVLTGSTFFAGAQTVLAGGSANDVITGSAQADMITGGGGDDTISGRAANDTIDGGPGTDTLDLTSETAGATVDLAAGTVTGSSVGADALTGIEAAVGTPQADTLAGSAGTDRLLGGGGDDVLDGRAGGDRLDGGLGTDTLTYAGAAGPVALDLAVVGPQPGAGGDDVSGVETLLGSPYADTLSGTDGPETIDPGAGTDRLATRGGADVVRVRDGATDTVSCGAGADTITADNVLVDTIDADCEARDVPAPGRLASTVSYHAKVASTGPRKSRSTRLKKLVVTDLPAGAVVVVSCTGKKHTCPLTSSTRSFPAATSSADLAGLLGKKALKPGAVLQVDVSAPQLVGRVVRLTIRGGKKPTTVSLCRVPGAQPAACT